MPLELRLKMTYKIPMDKPLILIVEDNPITQATLETGLVKRGFDVVVTGTAEDALEKIKAGLQVPIIILDLKLPGMNGADFSRIIKSDERWMWMSIIPLTSLVTPPDEPIDSLVQDFHYARNPIGEEYSFIPMLAKGKDEALKDFPPKLIPALVRALNIQHIRLPEGLKEESRKFLDSQFKGTRPDL